MENLCEKVREALDNSVENGYTNFLFTSTDSQIANDLREYYSDLEDEDATEIIPFILEWRREKRL